MRILSLDDHPLFSLGLKASLHAHQEDLDIQLVHEPQQALAILQSGEAFDLLILDITMPDMDGISFMHALHAREIYVPVAVLTAQEDLLILQKALTLGAMGILSKNSSPEELVRALQIMHGGEVYVPQRLALALQQVSKYAEENTQSTLSRRQFEILKMVQAGLSNQGIASVLFISERTVKSHLQSIFRILGAKNRVDSVRKAENLHILQKKS